MFDVFKSAVTIGSPESSRRVVLMSTMFISALVNVAIIVLSFMVCFRHLNNNTDVIQVLNVLVKLTVILMVFILLLSGIITWQNINETIQSVKGLPAGLQQLKSTVETTKTELTATTK